MTLFLVLISVYALGYMSGCGFRSIFQFDNDEHTCLSHRQLTVYHQRSDN